MNNLQEQLELDLIQILSEEGEHSLVSDLLFELSLRKKFAYLDEIDTFREGC